MGKITATDIDPSGGGGVSYSFISDWGVDTFSLDPITGVITVSAVDGLGEPTNQAYFLGRLGKNLQTSFKLNF